MFADINCVDACTVCRHLLSEHLFRLQTFIVWMFLRFAYIYFVNSLTVCRHLLFCSRVSPLSLRLSLCARKWVVKGHDKLPM